MICTWSGHGSLSCTLEGTQTKKTGLLDQYILPSSGQRQLLSSDPLYISSFQRLLYFYFHFLSSVTNVTFIFGFWFSYYYFGMFPLKALHKRMPFNSKFFLIALLLLHCPPVSHQPSVFSSVALPAFLPLCRLFVLYFKYTSLFFMFCFIIFCFWFTISSYFFLQFLFALSFYALFL